MKTKPILHPLVAISGGTLLAITFAATASAQQDVFSRSEVSTNLWWNDTAGQQPWFYSISGNQNRPDNFSTRHNVYIGHNNNTSMAVNGAFFQLRTLTIQNTVTSARTYTAQDGGGISLSTGYYNQGSANQTFHVPIGVDGSNVEFAVAGGLTTFSQNFFVNANTATFTGAGSTTISGAISGTGNVVLQSGTLKLASVNALTGNYTVNGGIFDLTNDAALGGATSLTFANGATLDNTSGSLVAITNNTMTKSLTGTFNYLGSSGANISLGGGTTTLNGNMTFNVEAAEITFNSPTTASGISIDKEGDGLLRFTNLQSGALAGDSTVHDGTLRIAGTSVIDNGVRIVVKPQGTLSLDGTITWGGTVKLQGHATLITETVIDVDTEYEGNVELQPSNGLLNGRHTLLQDAVVNSIADRLGTTPGTFVSNRIVMEENTTLRSLGNIEIHENKGILLNGNATLATNEANSAITVHSVISGAGSLAITGSGSGFVQLNGDNTYNGATTVSSGTLLINGDQSAATGNVVVNSGGKLGGIGTIGGAATVNGVVAPGTIGIGTLSANDDVSWNAGNNWQFDLGSNNSSDLLAIDGDFIRGTGSAFTFDFLGGVSAGTFTLVTWTGSNTGFSISDFDYTNLGIGMSGSFALNDNSLEFTAIPEPTAGIAGLLLGLGLLRRRRK
jgi:fibronectin-binding autotransporter adhesin